MALPGARTICGLEMGREHFPPSRCLHKHSGSEWDERESGAPAEQDSSPGRCVGVACDRSSPLG
jgi:hypothetical protein